MRRTIVFLAAVALMLAMVGTPAAAIPKIPETWAIWCDFDGDPNTPPHGTLDPWAGVDLGGRETYTLQEVLAVPGWILEPEGIHPPSIWLGGHAEVWENGVLTVEADFARAPGLMKKATHCLQVGPLEEDPDELVVIWDPIWLFFPPPGIPPSDG